MPPVCAGESSLENASPPREPKKKPLRPPGVGESPLSPPHLPPSPPSLPLLISWGCRSPAEGVSLVHVQEYAYGLAAACLPVTCQLPSIREVPVQYGHVNLAPCNYLCG